MTSTCVQASTSITNTTDLQHTDHRNSTLQTCLPQPSDEHHFWIWWEKGRQLPGSPVVIDGRRRSAIIDARGGGERRNRTPPVGGWSSLGVAGPIRSPRA